MGPNQIECKTWKRTLRVVEGLDLSLVLLGKEHEVLGGTLLADDLLDHFVHVTHTRRLGS